MEHHHHSHSRPSPLKPTNVSLGPTSKPRGLPETPKTHQDILKKFIRDPSPLQSTPADVPGSAVVCSRLADLSDWADLFQDVEMEGEKKTDESSRNWEPEAAKMENTCSQTTREEINNIKINNIHVSQEEEKSSCNDANILGDERPIFGAVSDECGESCVKGEELRNSDTCTFAREPSPGKVGALKQKKISDMFLRQVEKCQKNSLNGLSQTRKRKKKRDSGPSESWELLKTKRCKPNTPTNTTESSKSLKSFNELASNSKGHAHLVTGSPNKSENTGGVNSKNISRKVTQLSKQNELCGRNDPGARLEPPKKHTEVSDAKDRVDVEEQEQDQDETDGGDISIIDLPAGMKKLKIVLKDLRQQTTAGVVLVRYEKDMTLHICETCDKPLNSLSKLQQHSRIHTGEKPFKCRYCDDSRFFNQISQLQRHERLHTRDRPFACKCGRAFNTKYHMERHARSHERKVYECNLCDRTFWYDYALNTHIRVHHYDERKHQCTECNKKFKYLCQLKLHFRSRHTDERPYSCDQCDRKFACIGNVTSHKRVCHSDAKPYKCKECGHSFKLLRTLKNHLRTHTGERPFCCRYCSRTFTQYGNMTLHERICKVRKHTAPV